MSESTFPHPCQTMRLRIGREIYDNGPMTLNQLIVPNKQKYAKMIALEALMQADQVIEIDGVLHISQHMRERYADIVQEEQERARRPKPVLAEPRTVPAFKPIQAKHIPSAAGTRGDIARDIHFKNGGNDRVPFTGYNRDY